MATSTEVKKAPPETQVPLPEGVTAELVHGILVMKGPLGEVRKDFSRIPVQLAVDGGVVRVTAYGRGKKEFAITNTVHSLITNMITGVKEGFTYRLKIVYAHFPISVKVKGDEVHIENFLGERSARIAKIVGDCQVSVEGDDLVVKGICKEDAGQTAANIEQATKIKRKDQRVFLDGIYVYEKKG